MARCQRRRDQRLGFGVKIRRAGALLSPGAKKEEPFPRHYAQEASIMLTEEREYAGANHLQPLLKSRLLPFYFKSYFVITADEHSRGRLI